MKLQTSANIVNGIQMQYGWKENKDNRNLEAEHTASFLIQKMR